MGVDKLKVKLKKTCNMHQGHIKLDAWNLYTSCVLLNKDEITLVKNYSQLNICLAATVELLNIRNYLGINNKWKSNQV